MDPMDEFEMDDGVRSYIEAMAPEQRPLFDRLHRLVLRLHPEATLVLSYKMPTYKVGKRRLYIERGSTASRSTDGSRAKNPPSRPSTLRRNEQGNDSTEARGFGRHLG